MPSGAKAEVGFVPRGRLFFPSGQAVRKRQFGTKNPNRMHCSDFCRATPSPYGVEPLVFEAEWTQEGELQVETARIRRISRTEAFVEAALVDTRLRPAAEKLREQEKEVA